MSSAAPGTKAARLSQFCGRLRSCAHFAGPDLCTSQMQRATPSPNAPQASQSACGLYLSQPEVRLVAARQHLVDDAELARLLSGHEVVTVERPFNGLVGLAGVFDIDLV